MNLTDLIPKGKWHELSHSDDKEVQADVKAAHDKRCERIREFYADDVIACITQCGPMTNNIQQEFEVMMSTIALVDLIIERATGKTQ